MKTDNFKLGWVEPVEPVVLHEWHDVGRHRLLADGQVQFLAAPGWFNCAPASLTKPLTWAAKRISELEAEVERLRDLHGGEQ